MVRRLFGSLVHWSIGPLPLRAVEPQNRRTVGLNLPRCGVHAVMVTFSDAKTLLVLAKAKSPAVTRRLTSLFVETTFTPFIFKLLAQHPKIQRSQSLQRKLSSWVHRFTFFHGMIGIFTPALPSECYLCPEPAPGEQHFMALVAMGDHTRNGTLS
jgi:hypothetical protein